MQKASFVIKGENLKEDLITILENYHEKERSMYYNLGTGIIFMFDCIGGFSRPSLNVIIDDANIDQEVELHCILMSGQKYILDLDLFEREKKRLRKFHSEISRQSIDKSFNWTIGEINFK